MTHQPAYSLRQESASGGTALILDASCGQCSQCSDGLPLWCSHPLTRDARVIGEAPSDTADAVIDSLVAAGAVAAIPTSVFDGAPTVAIGKNAGIVATFIRRIVPGPVLVAYDPRDDVVRHRLSQSHPSARPRVAVSGDNLRAAVRFTRRGGVAAGPLGTGERPSVTEVVQREVTVVEARDVTELVARLTPQDWADASAASRIHTHFAG